jgi:hypothetical protein
MARWAHIITARPAGLRARRSRRQHRDHNCVAVANEGGARQQEPPPKGSRIDSGHLRMVLAGQHRGRADHRAGGSRIKPPNDEPERATSRCRARMSEAKSGRSCLDVQIAHHAWTASGVEPGCRLAHPGYACFHILTTSSCSFEALELARSPTPGGLWRDEGMIANYLGEA